MPLLDRLGDPEEIAAEARERFGLPTRERSWVEIGAIVLLLFGGSSPAWLARGRGAVWLSSIWTTRDKLIGTFVVPGGLFLPGLIPDRRNRELFAGCSGVDGGPETCTPDPPVYEMALWSALLVVSVLGPIFTAVYLAHRSRRLSAAG